jgi:hypothetical protein
MTTTKTSSLKVTYEAFKHFAWRRGSIYPTDALLFSNTSVTTVYLDHHYPAVGFVNSLGRCFIGPSTGDTYVLMLFGVLLSKVTRDETAQSLLFRR